MSAHPRALAVLLALHMIAPATAAAQSAARCVVVEWPHAARDLLAVGVTNGMPLPEANSPPVTSRAVPPLDALAARLRALRRTPALAGYALRMDARARVLVLRLRPIDALAERAEALRNVATTVEALVLQAQAYEYVADQLGRLSELVETTPAEREFSQRVDQRLARLRHLAETDVRAREMLEQILAEERDAPLCQRAFMGGPEQSCRASIEQRWFEESLIHRRIAIVLYATAVHFARAHHAMSTPAWSAVERLRDEANRGALDDALTQQSLFTPGIGEFDPQSPGATLMESALISGARIAR